MALLVMTKSAKTACFTILPVFGSPVCPMRKCRSSIKIIYLIKLHLNYLHSKNQQDPTISVDSVAV